MDRALPRDSPKGDSSDLESDRLSAMDPDAALKRWRAGDPDAQEDLKEWLRRGGFEPRWAPDKKTALANFKHDLRR